MSIGFLSFFLVDVVLRLYSIGYTYFKSILHFIDAVAIVVTLAMAINGQSAAEMAQAQIDACLESEYAEQCGKLQASDTANAVIRNVKLFRLFIVMERGLRTMYKLAGRENPHPDRHRYSTVRGATNWEPPATAKAEQKKAWAEEFEGIQETHPSLVSLLTWNFSMLLDSIKKADKNHDGVLTRKELVPMLRKAGHVHKPEAEHLFKVLAHATKAARHRRACADGGTLSKEGMALIDGVEETVDVSELYEAGIYLKQLLHEDAEFGKKQLEAVKKMQAKCCKQNVCKRAFQGMKAKAMWVFKMRWIDSHTRGLVNLRRARETRRFPVRKSNHAPYFFSSGKVDVEDHINGSGAVLEDHVARLMNGLSSAHLEVGELSLKLQEIEIAQRRDTKQLPQFMQKYHTYLMGLAKALPAAVIRLQPFLNEVEADGEACWHSLRPHQGVVERVNLGAILISVFFILSTLVRFASLIVFFIRGEDNLSPAMQRLECEQFWAFTAYGNETKTLPTGEIIPNVPQYANFPNGTFEEGIEAICDSEGRWRVYWMVRSTPLVHSSIHPMDMWFGFGLEAQGAGLRDCCTPPLDPSCFCRCACPLSSASSPCSAAPSCSGTTPTPRAYVGC